MVRKQDIKIWMLKKGISGKDVADSIGVSKSYFSHFLKGKKNAPRIREWLLGQGCPAKYLGEGKKEAA
jgi:transcriptional regulator with XRE-family HTH domain